MDILEAIQTRRSIRKFTNDPVSHTDLVTILNAARMAPSGGNLQLWHFYVVQDRQILDQMKCIIQEKIEQFPSTIETEMELSEEFISNLTKRFKAYSLFFTKAPVTICVTVKNNPYAFPSIQYLTYKGMGLYEANQYMGHIEIQSAAAAIENILLAALALGYGACWMSVPFIAKDNLKELLGVKPHWDLIAMVPIGRPDPNYPIYKVNKKDLEDITTFL